MHTLARARRAPRRRGRGDVHSPCASTASRQWSRAIERVAQRWDTLRDAHDRRPCPTDRPPVPRGVAEAPYDAVVVGAGPNGLAAAIELARAGRSVRVVERAARGRGRHPHRRADAARLPPRRLLGDPSARVSARRSCSALPLAEHGLELPPARDSRRPSARRRQRGRRCTGRSTRRPPAWAPTPAAYESLMGPLVRDWDEIADLVLGPPRLPRRPLLGGPLRPSRAA